MDEVKFAFKLFLASLVIVAILQGKVGKMSIEDHLQEGFQHSWIAKPLQKVVDGAVLALRNGTQGVTHYVNEVVSGPETQKASRLNINFDRTEAAIQPQKARAEKRARAIGQTEE